MKTLVIELRKEKRTGVIPVLLAVGILGAAYAFVNFIVRKDTLLNLPLAPMDVLLTQLYEMCIRDRYIAATGRVRGADDVIAYHVRQSFRPGEITSEEANRLGVEFAKRFTKGNHALIFTQFGIT